MILVKPSYYFFEESDWCDREIKVDDGCAVVMLILAVNAMYGLGKCRM